MNIRQMKPIQQHSFSYLINNYNTAMIGFSKGKSVSYLASVFSSIMNDSENKKVSNNKFKYMVYTLMYQLLFAACILEK